MIKIKNIIKSSYNTASKCLGGLIFEYYKRLERKYYFLVIYESHILLKSIYLVMKTMQLVNVVLTSATADDNKHFA